MEIKHKRVFQPVAIETFSLQEIAADYCAVAEKINLYSTDRGMNRFESLALAFQRLSDTSATAAKALEGHAALQAFVQSGGPLSLGALESYNADKRDPFLAKTLEWSRQADRRYAEIMETEGNAPFALVPDILKRAFVQSEIVVISSSSRETLEKDWGAAGLLDAVTRIEGQEQGSKATQLNRALENGRSADQALMIGDAIGDHEAAKAHGLLFYPIIPGAEIDCWQRFQDEALERFYGGTYAGSYAASLVSTFQAALSGA